MSNNLGSDEEGADNQDSDVDKEAIDDLMETFEFFERNQQQQQQNKNDNRDDHDEHEDSTNFVSMITRQREGPNETMVNSYKEMMNKPLPKTVHGSLFPGFGAGVLVSNSSQIVGGEGTGSQNKKKKNNKRGSKTTKESDGTGEDNERQPPVHISLDEIATMMGKKSPGGYKIQRYVKKSEKRKRKNRKKLLNSNDEDEDDSLRKSVWSERSKRKKKHKKKRKSKIKKPGTMFSSTEYYSSSLCSEDHDDDNGEDEEEQEDEVHTKDHKEEEEEEEKAQFIQKKRKKSEKSERANSFEEDSFFMSDSTKEMEGEQDEETDDDEEGDDHDEIDRCFSMIPDRKKNKKKKSKESSTNPLTQALMERSSLSSQQSERGRNSSSMLGDFDDHDEEEIMLRGQGSNTSSEDGGHHIIREGYIRNGRGGPPARGDDGDGNNHHVMSVARRESIYGRDGDPRTCFLCQFGNVRYDSVISTDINTLWEMIYSNYFSVADTEGLASAAYAYYYENIYLKAIQNGQDLPQWSERGMYIHITEHMGDPRIFLGESIKNLSMMRRMLYNFCIVKDEEGTTKPDIKVCAEVRMITKQILDLYKSDVQNMFGYCESFRADPSQMHRLIHMSRVKFKETAAIESSRGTFS